MLGVNIEANDVCMWANNIVTAKCSFGNSNTKDEMSMSFNIEITYVIPEMNNSPESDEQRVDGKKSSKLR